MTSEPSEIKPGGARSVGPESTTSGWSYRPRFDVTEGPDEFTIFADMPGATASGIRINFESGTLAIHAEVEARQGGEIEYLTHEYGVGDFDRELVISDTVNADRISAEFEHGVLTVHLPKSEGAKPRRIPVRAVTT